MSGSGRRGVPSVVILVDSRIRDLAVAGLIERHLERRGIACHLEPLEAYRAVLGAHRPWMILFNHLTASHLVAYSKQLAERGVLTAVLPNEGIMYDEDDLKFNAGRYHSGAHIDYYFCWNELHAAALRETGADRATRIEVVGVPRFDFYFEPWSRMLRIPAPDTGGRPRLLVCTNFCTAKFWELPREAGDRFFAAWKDRIPLYRNYWQAIEDHHKGRQRFLDYLRPLVETGRFDVTVRPHPREDPEFYREWVAALPDDQRRWVRVDAESNITSLILGCDLEISCETCTTAMESWIAGRPTVELQFEGNPLWCYAEHAACNVPCSDPSTLVDLVASELAGFNPANPPAARTAHLAKWCASPNGGSSERLADAIADALRGRRPPDFSGLTWSDRRRALKLRLTGLIGEAYHYNPFLPMKRLVAPQRHAMQTFSYEKSIRPGDVRQMRERLRAIAADDLTDRPEAASSAEPGH